MERKIIFVLSLLLLILVAIPVKANEVEDLYALYDVQYIPEVPKEITDVIERYQNAERYTFMYQYVATSEYDKEIVNSSIKEHKKRLKEIEDELLCGYDKSLNDIYLLEDEYRVETQRLEDTQKSLKSLSVESSMPNVDAIPSKDEYLNALNKKAEILSNHSIGSIENLSVPIHAQYMVEDTTDNIFTYLTVDDTAISALFNGVVEQASDDMIVLNHYNGIKTYYSVKESKVSEGDSVYQGQLIGACTKYPSIQMTLQGVRMNLDKLFEEVNKDEEG